MKFPLQKFFRKTKSSAPAEAQASLPQFSLGFRAMAFLTASVIFLQAPVSLMAAIWDPFKQLDANGVFVSSGDVGGGRFLNFELGTHWLNGEPPGNGTANFRLFTQSYEVIVDGEATAGGLLTTPWLGTPGTTVSIVGSGSTPSLALGAQGIAVSAGTLLLGATLPVRLDASQAWTITGGSVLEVASQVSGGSTGYGISKQGSGLLVLSGTNTFSGGLSISDGVVRINASGTSSTNSAIGTGLLTINGGSLDNTSGSAGSAVTLATNNLQAWNGDFAYIGSLGRALNVGTGAVTLGGDRTVTVNAGSLAVGGIIGGTYSLTKAGAGQLTLSGANTYTGGLTLAAGQLNLNSAEAAGAGTLTIRGGSIDNTSAAAVVLTNASQVWDGGFTFIGSRALNTGTGDITLSTGTVLTIQGGVFTVGGELGGNASITKAGAGKLHLDAAAAYTGFTTVNEGTLSTNAADFLPTGSNVTIGSLGSIQLGGAQTLASLSGAGSLALFGALTLSNGSGNSFSGVLSGSGGVNLLAGTLTLGGTNTYSGITELSDGAILKLENAAALGGTVDSTTVLAGAVLDLNGQAAVAESIVVNGTGVSAAGALINGATLGASLTGTLTLQTNSSIGGSGNLTLSGGVVDLGNVRGLSKVGVGTLTLAGSSSYSGATTVSQGILRLGSINALGDGATNTSGVTVASDAALDLNGTTSAVNVALAISGTGILGTGVLTNSSTTAATYGGQVTLDAASAVSGGITLTGDISGANTLTKVGSGTLALSGGANAATAININSGVLQVGTSATSGTLGIATVSIASGAEMVFQRVDDYTAAVNNVISGSGNVTVASGTLTLGGTNTYTGITRLLNGSSLILGSTDALGASSEARVDTGALLDLSGNSSAVALTLDGRSDSVAALANSGALVTYGGSVSLAAGTVSAIGGSGDIILSRAVSGGTLAKVGANTLTLGSLNSFGKTSVNSGTLKLTDTGSFGTDDVQVNTGAQITFARTDASVVNNAISGSGAVSVEAGTLTLTGENTSTGLTTILSGATLSIGTGGTTGSLASDIALGAGSFLNFNRSNDSVYGGTLSGAGTFTKLGAGTLGLFNVSDLSAAGTILVSEGVLSIGTGGATGELEGNINNTAEVRFNRTGTLAYNGVISGTGAVSSTGAGEITLTNPQTYSGATTVSAGTLNLNSFNTAAPLTLSNVATVNVAGADLTLSGAMLNNAATGGSLSFTAGAGTITLNGGLSGTGATGFGADAAIAGTLSSGSVTVTGSLRAGDISGGLISARSLNGGTVRGGVLSVLDEASLNVVSGGSLTLSGPANGVTTLNGGTIVLQSGTTTLLVSGGQQAATGSITGSGSLISVGTLTLLAANTYTGGTKLDSGTLLVGANSALGTGLLTVADGASFGAAVEGVTLANQISLGGSLALRGEHSLAVQGSVALSGASTLDVTVQTLTLGGSIVAGGNSLTKLGGGTLALLTGAGSDIELTINGGSVTAAAGALGATATVTTGSQGTFLLLGSQSIQSVDGAGSLLLGSSSLTLSSGGNYSGVVSGGSASFLNLPTGSLAISGTSNTFLGTLAVTGGTVDLSGTTQSVGAAILNGGTIQNGTLSFTNLTLSAGNYAADLTGSGDVVKDVNPGTVALNGNNSTFLGRVLIQGGTLEIGLATAVSASNAIIFDASAASPTLTLSTDITVASLSGGSLAGGSQGFLNLNSSTLTLSGTANTIYGGSIATGAGARLVKAGSGTQVLAGDATGAVFATRVSGGILEIANPLALGSTANAIALSGGTLSLSADNLLADQHTLEVTSPSSLVLGGTLSQALGALTIGGTLEVTAIASATSSTIQELAFLGTTTLSGTSTLSIGSYASVAVGAVSGNFDFTKSGAGALKFTDTNSSTGQTFITGGSLILGANGSLASGSLSVTGDTTVLDLVGTTQVVGGVTITNATARTGTLEGSGFTLDGATVSSRLTGAGSLTSTGLTTLLGRNDYTGDTSVSTGSLTIEANGSLNSSGNLLVSAGAFANFLGTTASIGSISGLGTTVFSGTANVTSDLAEGVINIAGNANLADIAGAKVTVDGAATAGLLSGSLTLNGSGSTLGTVSGGTLTLAAGKTAVVATLSAGDITAGGTLEALAGTFAGSLAGAGSLTVSGGNSVTLNGTLSAFTGLYLVDGSTLTLGAATASSASLKVLSVGGTANLASGGGSLGAVTNDGLVTLDAGTYTLGSLNGGVDGVVSSVTPSSLKVGALGSDSVFAGSLSGGISLTKLGAGSLTLSGNSDFTGITTIAEGTLVAASSQALSSGTILVSGTQFSIEGGVPTLGLSNGIVLANDIHLSGTIGPAVLANLDGENRAGLITVTFGGRIALESGSLVTGSVASTGSSAFLDINGRGNNSLTVDGDVSLGNGSLDVRDANLILLGTVSAGQMRVSGGQVGLYKDINAELSLESGVAARTEADLTVSTLSSDTGTSLALGHSLTIADGAERTAAGVISGSGSLTLGSGSLTLAGFNTYTGGTTITDGFLNVTGSLAANSDLTISAGTAQFANATVLGAVTNAGLLRFLSTGTMASLSGNGVTLFAGGVQLGDVTGGSLTIATLNTATTNTVGALSSVNLTVTPDSTVTAASVAGGSSNISGTLNVTGEVTSGTFINVGIITAGTLTAGDFAIGAGGVLNAGGGVFTGSLSGAGSLNTTGTLTIAQAALLAPSLVYTVAGTGSLTLDTDRTLGTVTNLGLVTFTQSGTITALGGTGTTAFGLDADLGTVSGGTVTVGRNTVLGTLSGGSVTSEGSVAGTSVTGGQLVLNGSSNTLQSVSGGSLNVNGSTSIALLSGGTVENAAALSVSGGTFGGTLSGAGDLNVAGNFTLSGSQVGFTGAIFVNGTATLAVANPLSGVNALTVDTAATAVFRSDAELESLANAGSVGFQLAATVGSLTGSGTTRFVGEAVLQGGVSAGVVDAQGGSDIGAVTGGSLTLGSGMNQLLSIDLAADVTLASGAEATVATLTGGTVRNAGILSVDGGAFSGSLLGAGTLITTGVFSIESGATLGADLTHEVTLGGTLTLVDAGTLKSLDNEGTVSFSGTSAASGVQSLLGSGTTNFAADALLGTVEGGSISVAGKTTFGSISGGYLTSVGSLTGGTLSGGVVELTANGNSLSLVSGGELLNVSGSTRVNDLESGIVVNETSASLTVGTFRGGSVTNDGAMSVSGGVFTGTLSGEGALAVNGSLTLSGDQTGFSGAVSVGSGTLLLVNTAVGSLGSLSVETLGSADFTPAATLFSLANAGSVTFRAATEVGTLTGLGTTTFLGGTEISGGISEGVVSVTGSFNIGAVTGGSLTFSRANGAASQDNLVESVSGGADVTILALAEAAVGELSGGTVRTSGKLEVMSGNFTGSLLGTGTVHTTGELSIGSLATLASTLRHSVSEAGSLSFSSHRPLGVLENDGNVTFVNGGSWTSQSGSGTVTVRGGTLSATNGTGSLVVSNGASANYSQAASLVSVTNSGSLAFATSSSIQNVESTGRLEHVGTLTISGGSLLTLSGSASTRLVKNDVGTLTLQTGLVYLGSTDVLGGILKLDDGAKLNGPVTVDGGQLLLGGTSQFGGELTLKSGVINLGGFTQIILGSFSASGGELNGTATLRADALNITGGTMNAKTVLNGDGPLNYNGTFSQPVIGEANSDNAFFLQGAGGTITTGTILAPSLTVSGSSNTLRLDGGSQVAAPEATAITIAGSNNTVEFTQGFAPSGSLVLTVGDATSNGGTLVVLGNGLVLGSAQTLKGKGRIVGNVTLGSGATFAPGNSPGVTTVAGTVIVNGATLNIEFDRLAPGGVQQDQVVVVAPGTAVVNGGTLSLNLGTGASRFRVGFDTFLPVFATTSGTALITGGSGFSSIIAPAAYGVSFSAGTLSFTANGFSKVNGVTGNVSATGALVDAAVRDGSDVGNLRVLIDTGALGSTNAATVAAALSALNPGVYAELGNIGLDRLRDVQAGLSNHIDMLALDTVGESSLSLAVKPGQSAAAAAIEQSRAWTTAYGGWGKRDSDSTVGSAGYSSNNFGNISGVETKVGALTLGITGAVGTSTANFESGRGKVTTDSWHTGVYGNVAAGVLVLDASIVYGQSDSLLRRSVDLAGGGSTSGRSQGSEWTGQFGLAVPLRTSEGSLVFTPSVHLLHSNVKQDALTETSLNGLEASVRGNTAKSTAIRTGVQAAKITKLAGMGTRLTASLDWVHGFNSDRNDVEIALAGAGSTTSRFQGSRTGQDAIRFGLGAEVALTERTRFRLNVDEQMRSGVRSTYGSASFGLQF